MCISAYLCLCFVEYTCKKNKEVHKIVNKYVFFKLKD